MDFPVSRGIIDLLDDWFHLMAARLPEPVEIDDESGRFHWEFPERSAEVVQVAKAVRMVSGIRAALELADTGFTTECATILRTVSDLASEIGFLGEGLLGGRFTRDQSRFIEQFFTPMPVSPDELAGRKGQYYLSRKDLQKALKRLAEKTTGGADELIKLADYLSKGYDSYVHGGYRTAMELYSGAQGGFMLSGHQSERHRCIAHVAVAAKLHEVLMALGIMALTREMRQLVAAISGSRHELDSSDEMSSSPCNGLM